MITQFPVPVLAGLLAMLAGLAWSAASDLKQFLIPNRACALVAGGYLAAALGTPFAPWLAGLVVGLLTLGVGTALFARGWVGGGDVKLAAVIALWAGPTLFAGFLFATSIAALLLALVLLSPLRRAVTSAGEAETGLGQPMPFGAPLAVGGAYVAAMWLQAFA
jgi:prepilin peptidase CpaA